MFSLLNQYNKHNDVLRCNNKGNIMRIRCIKNYVTKRVQSSVAPKLGGQWVASFLCNQKVWGTIVFSKAMAFYVRVDRRLVVSKACSAHVKCVLRDI